VEGIVTAFNFKHYVNGSGDIHLPIRDWRVTEC